MVLASTLENRLSPAIALSFAVHAVLALLVFAWSLFGPARLQVKPGVYKVAIVSLSPNQKPAASSALPKATVEQIMNAKPQITPAKPPDVKLHEKAVAPKPADKAVKPIDLQKEVARIKQDLKLKEAVSSLGSQSAAPPVSAPAQTAKPADGAGVAGGGQEGQAGLAEGLEQAQYQEVIRAQVLNAWNLPQSALLSLPKDTYAMVSVYIGEDGSLIRMEFQKSSNVAFFDQSVTRAIRRAAPLAPPPQSLAEEAREKGIVMRFSPQKVSP